MDGAGEQLLAGAGFAAQEHRGMGLGHHRDLVQQRADLLAVADDAADPRRRRLEIGQLLLQPMALGDQPLAITRHHAMELDRLADEIGDHGKEAHVGIEPKHRLAVPDPIDGQRSHHLRLGADRNADEGDRRAILGVERLAHRPARTAD